MMKGTSTADDPELLVFPGFFHHSFDEGPPK